MKLLWLFVGVVFTKKDELTVQEQKINHLTKVTTEFIDLYLNETIHDEVLSPYSKRKNMVRRFKVRLEKLTNIADKAVVHDCYGDGFSRSSEIGRFVRNKFRKGRIQIVRSYVRLGKQIPEDSSNKCIKKRENLLKKIEKLDKQLFDFYCTKVSVTEECTKEYNNEFISKVQA